MTDKDIQHVSFQGIHHSKNPSLAVDGTALESFNLRPGKNGLELVHDKEMTKIVRVPNDAGMAGKKITFVFRHHALPENSYLFVFDNRTVMLSLDGVMQKEDDGSYFKIEYDEDIIDMGELNNVLVIRTDSKQDFWLWHENRYTKMPPVRMPREMILEQDFDETTPTSVHDRPFFDAVLGFKVPDDSGLGFDENYRTNLEQALQFVQGVRAENESQQRKLGKFVGHVLVRCAFKTAQENYISYGPVLHAEIGSYAQTNKTSRFPRNADDDEKGFEWYQKIYAKLLDDNLGQNDNIIPPEGAEWEDGPHSLWPITCLWNVGAEGSGTKPTLKISHDGLLRNAGFSQPPVFVGAVPYSVYKNLIFRGHDDRLIPGDNTTKKIKSFGPGFWRSVGGNDDNNKNIRQMAIGVYVPGIIYSYPVLKIVFDQEMIDTLKFYRENNIIQSFCVSMTAPVKHGNGTSLVKVNSIKYDFFSSLPTYHYDYSNDGAVVSPSPLYMAMNILPDENSENRKNNDYLDVYGYPRNIDTNPERLMDRPFYIVKDIPLEELLADDDLVAGKEYVIPLQLKDIGVIEEVQDDETVKVITSSEEVAKSQEEQVYPNYVSINNIENAKQLPTDNFSAHSFFGSYYMEYNRRLHIFGVETILFEGFCPSMPLKRSEFGYGGHKVQRRGVSGFKDGLYFECVIISGNKKCCMRTPIDAYMSSADGKKVILNDILAYPDYRCKTMRIVLKDGEGWRNVSGDMECKNSVLNNLAYVAFTSKDISDVGDIRLSFSNGITLSTRIDRRNENVVVNPETDVYYIQVYDAYVYKEQSQNIAIGQAGYGYAPDDTLVYYDKEIDISKDKSSYPLIDYGDFEINGNLKEGNRLQLSGTDDVFFYPSVNSYRFGTLDNRIIAANSVYGQVTEQKFGMFPLYVFSSEGVYVLEQGTGDIMYSNISKINDDCLTGKFSICNTGDSIAYVVRDGLRLIQGRQAMRIGEHGDGKPYIILPPSKGVFKDSVSSFADLVSLDRFNNDIQDSVLFYDSYNHEILILCKNHPLRKRLVTFAFNTDTNQLFKRFDSLNESSLSGIVHGSDNLVWHSEIKAGNVNTVRMYDFDTSDQEYGESGLLDKSEFLYVSNPIKLSEGAYKRIEHSVMRFYGSGIESLELLYFGSLDCIKWFQMGGGRVSSIKEMTDFTMRRMPCSVRYVIVVIKGKAEHIQIQGLDAEIRMRYAGRLR